MKKMINFLRLPLKGFVALLVIQVAVFLAVLSIQSCKKSDIQGDRTLQKNEIKKLNALVKERREAVSSLSAVLLQNRDEIMRLAAQRNDNKTLGSMSRNMDSNMSSLNDTTISTILSEYELECKAAVEPIYNQSTSVIASYGITEQDLVDEWGANYDPELVVTLGFAISAYEELQAENSMAKVNSSLFLVTPSYAGKFYDCAMRAFGIEGVLVLYHERALSTYAGKRAMLKMVGKVATRSLGWVGAALVVADFSLCYY